MRCDPDKHAVDSGAWRCRGGQRTRSCPAAPSSIAASATSEIGQRIRLCAGRAFRASRLRCRGTKAEHRDAAILLSLPGLGRKIGATMLSEACQAIAERDYHGLRCYCGCRSGDTPERQKIGGTVCVEAVMNGMRNALYHWARNSIIRDPKATKMYARMRAAVNPTAAPCEASPIACWMPCFHAPAPNSLRSTEACRLTQGFAGPLAGGRVSTGEKHLTNGGESPVLCEAVGFS